MKKILALFICAFAFGSCCNMKKLQRDAMIKTVPTTLELEADNAENPVVDIDFKIEVPKKSVPKKAQMIYQPQFLTSMNQYDLQPVVINGKKRAKQEAKMLKKGMELPYPKAIRVEGDKKPISMKYSMDAPVQDWMQDSELIGWTLVDCGKHREKVVVNRQVIASSIKVPEIVVAPIAEIITEEVISQMDALETTYFVVNSSEFDMSFWNNSKNFNDLKALMQKIKTDNNLKLISVNIIGSASPEGTDKINTELARHRAQTIADMISNDLGISSSMINVSSMGANWQGFTDMISKSSLPNKMDIISIANSGGTDWQKTLKLRNLYNYNLLKTDYFPLLRMVKCDVKFTSTDTVTREIIAE